MRDRELYARILGITAPWSVTRVELDTKGGEVDVYVEVDPLATLTCSKCGEACSGYDHRVRRWRHLDTCQYRTMLTAQVPRVVCAKHGVVQVSVPWAEPGSRFTALFESLVINWLLEASFSAVARQLRLSWDQVDTIMQRAVRRGLQRRTRSKPTRIGVDETSFRKGHRYVSVVSDMEKSVVVHVADGREAASVESFFETFEKKELAAIEVVAMDMAQAYVRAVTNYVPEADKKIAFDRFHVAKYLGEATNKVRIEEHKEFLRVGDRSLTGSKYYWLRSPEEMDADAKKILAALRASSVKSARAWAIKEAAKHLWHYVSRTWAEKQWKRWISWAIRSRLDPMKKAGRMIREHLWGIINAIVLKATNAGAESINGKIQKIKAKACGFRNRERFHNAIYFHLGGLDLYPDGA